ncbi:hypothetical protein TUA1478L_04080 [Lactiplantibacillus plantarum]
MGRANECGILEDPWQGAPADAFDRTKALADTPDTPTTLEITFEAGVPVALDGESLNLADLIIKLDQIAGEHGIGRIDHIENRLVGIKSREVYEAPAATVLLKAHKDLEDLTFERELAHFKPIIEQKLADTIYNGLWFSPLMEAMVAFLKQTQQVVNGVVRVQLFKGNVITEGGSHPTHYMIRTWQPIHQRIHLTNKRQLVSLSYGAYQRKLMPKSKRRLRLKLRLIRHTPNEYPEAMGWPVYRNGC